MDEDPGSDQRHLESPPFKLLISVASLMVNRNLR